MKKSVAMKWVEALRSGKYEQGQNCLKREDGTYCCLGALCDISKLGKWDGQLSYQCKLGGSFMGIPKEVQEWSGMKSSLGHYINKAGQYRSLAGYNDGDKQPGQENPYRASFPEIADFIEKNWRGL